MSHQLTVGDLLQIVDEILNTERAIAQMESERRIIAPVDPKITRLKEYCAKLRSIPLNADPSQLPPTGVSNGNEEEGSGPRSGNEGEKVH